MRKAVAIGRHTSANCIEEDRLDKYTDLGGAANSYPMESCSKSPPYPIAFPEATKPKVGFSKVGSASKRMQVLSKSNENGAGVTVDVVLSDRVSRASSSTIDEQKSSASYGRTDKF